MAIWKKIILAGRSWLVYENGTVVIIPDAITEDALKKEANTILDEWGEIRAGSQYGDFFAREQNDTNGWLVGYPVGTVLNFVHNAESDTHNEMVMGMLGRQKRHRDWEERKIIHCEISE